MWNLELSTFDSDYCTSPISAFGTIVFSPNEKSFALIKLCGTINIWKLDSSELPQKFDTQIKGGDQLIKYHQNGKYLLSSSCFGDIVVWDIEKSAVHCKIGTIGTIPNISNTYLDKYGNRCNSDGTPRQPYLNPKNNGFTKHGIVVGNKFVACQMNDASITIWGIFTGKLVKKQQLTKQQLTNQQLTNNDVSLVFTNDESFLICDCGGFICKIQTFDDAEDVPEFSFWHAWANLLELFV